MNTNTETSQPRRYDCSDPEQRATGLKDAASTVRRGELVVLPTDTVYGIGADAFGPDAVRALLDAKARGRDMPVPVLVGSVRAATALVEDLTPYGQDLVEEFWPGGLTLICRHTSTLNWDLGETEGTVAVRMPLDQVALELLKNTGPMAVSSANRSGEPPATTCDDAEEQLGNAVAVYLDGGRCGNPVPSSIVDLTGPVPRLLREGAISADRLREVVQFLVTDEDEKQGTNEDEKQDEKQDLDKGSVAEDGDERDPYDAPAPGDDDRPAVVESGLDSSDPDRPGDQRDDQREGVPDQERAGRDGDTVEDVTRPPGG